jgi:hypothetical protein
MILTSRLRFGFAFLVISVVGCTSGTGQGGGAGSGGSGGSGGGAGGGSGSGGGGSGGTAGGGGAPVDGGGTGGAGGSATDAGPIDISGGCTPAPLDMSGTLQGRFGSVNITAGSSAADYFLQVNQWNAGSNVTVLGNQTMDYGGDFVFKMTTQTGVATTTGGPTGFPSIFIGANSRHTTTNSNLPRAVTLLTTVPTTWIWNDNGTLADNTANSYNATYDVWFSTNMNGDPNASGPTGGFLMVWLHKPADAQPIGQNKYPATTIPGMPGTWDIWVGLNGTRPCISYVRTETTLGFGFDLNLLIQDAVANRVQSSGAATIQSGWYLSNIFTGFEIWRGGVGLESTSFCAVVN